MTVLDTQAPAKMGQRKWTGRPGLAWTVAVIAIAALIVTAMLRTGQMETAGLARGEVLEELVDLGYLPDRAVETGDIYSQREQAMIDAVNRGLVPRQTLDQETYVLKGIIDRLVPRDS